MEKLTNGALVTPPQANFIGSEQPYGWPSGDDAIGKTYYMKLLNS